MICNDTYKIDDKRHKTHKLLLSTTLSLESAVTSYREVTILKKDFALVVVPDCGASYRLLECDAVQLTHADCGTD